MKTKKMTALILTILLLFGTASIFSSAEDMEWSDYYDSYYAAGGRPLMSPGSNEKCRNFSWYSPKGSKECHVDVCESEDMANAKSYYGSTTRTPEGDNVNKVTVNELKEGTTYYYKCITSLSESETAKFTTSQGNNFTALYLTDIHVTYDEDSYDEPLKSEACNVHNVLTQATDKKDIELVISAGDQGSYGLRSEYISVLASPLWQSIPFALCVGNHDRKGFDFKYFNNNPNEYQKGISSYIAGDYWYTKGDVLFMVFDSNNYSATTHKSFAREAVAQNPDIKWKIAVFHHDLYGIMSEKRLTLSNDTLQPIFAQICDELGVDLALTGHTHYYSMTNPIFDGRATQSIEGESSITDAQGTIYAVSGSINHPRTPSEDDVYGENLAYTYTTTDVIYNILDFSEDCITINSYLLDSDEPFRTFTINKTDSYGGHPEYKEKSDRWWTDFKLDFQAFFEEFGIMMKVLFNEREILNMQRVVICSDVF